MSAVIVDGVKPTLAELERFEEQPEGKRLNSNVVLAVSDRSLAHRYFTNLRTCVVGIDLELPTVKEDKALTHSFSTGDNVEVSEGELINLQGKIIAIDGSMITVMPKHEDLKVKKQRC